LRRTFVETAKKRYHDKVEAIYLRNYGTLFVAEAMTDPLAFAAPNRAHAHCFDFLLT